MITADLGLFASLQLMTGTLDAEARPRQRLVLVATAETETPLPLSLAPTFLPDGPTGLATLAPSIEELVPSVQRHVSHLGGILRVDTAAQEMVDRLVADNRPPRGERRKLRVR